MEVRNVDDKFRARASAFQKVIALELVVSIIMWMIGAILEIDIFQELP